MNLPSSATVIDVCPRDGFQNVKDFIETEHKVAIIRKLVDAGFREIEVTSFVSPKWVPQLADAKDVVAAVRAYAGDKVNLIGLIPNLRGLESAVEAGVDEVSFVVSVSEAHNKNNVNKTTQESLALFAEMMKSKPAGMKARLALATCFGCPFNEEIQTEKIIQMIESGLVSGADEFLLADTIGKGDPKGVDEVLKEVVKVISPDKITMHLHDTAGLALANTLAAMQNGVSRFEAAAGGLGGCPYAPGASGNCASEDLVEMLARMGIASGIDQVLLDEAVDLVREHVNAPIVSHMAGRIKSTPETCGNL